MTISHDINDRKVEFFPEVLDPDSEKGRVYWTVEEVEPHQSGVYLTEKRALIPKARTRATEQIRFHEAAHVANTDDHTHEVEWMTQVCKMLEEYRVDFIMATRNGLPLHHRHDDYDMEWLEHEAPRDQFPVAMEWLQFRFAVEDPTVAPDVMNYWMLMANRLPTLTVNKLEAAVAALAGDPTPECREREAKTLLDYFMPPPPAKKDNPPPLKEEVKDEIRRQQTEERQQEQEEKREASKPKPGKKIEEKVVGEDARRKRTREDQLAGLDAHNPGGTGCQFMIGRMEVHDHTSRNMFKTVPVKAPYTQTNKGQVPEFMERFCVDQRIYRREHRGGVILLDCSGSMRPDWSMITQQMHEFPNLVVMAYQGVEQTSGYATHAPPSERGKTVSGRLCIYSKGGRIDPLFQSEPGHNGGNYVDYEALNFASKFRGPRIWLSDGKACGGQYDTDGGGYGKYNSNLQGLVRDVMKRHHWVRIRHLEEAFHYLTSRRAVQYHLVGLTSPNRPQETRIGRR